jgi:hypothetical protein
MKPEHTQNNSKEIASFFSNMEWKRHAGKGDGQMRMRVFHFLFLELFPQYSQT